MELNIWVAFGAGIASFISPCTLPLYPSYLSYITGMSVSQISAKDGTREVRRRTMAHTFFFLLGLSIVYYIFGFVAGKIADIFILYSDVIRQIAAVLFILMGLFLIGLFKPKFMMRDTRVNVKVRSASYLSSFLVGIGFAAGWSPCIGPIFGAIITLAATEQGTWLQLTTAYVIGFAVPFFALAFFVGSFRALLRHTEKIMKVGGSVMIVIGILLFTGHWTKLANWLNSITPTWLQF